MELQALQSKLSDQLKRNNATILDTSIWCVPVHTVTISYKPVVRTKMDILMKMLLLSVQKSKFKKAEQLSEILLVEELFVQDLLSKMERTELIRKEEYYQLTEKGSSQLASGIFEENQDVKTMELLYSPTHKSFLQGEIESVLDYEDFPEDMYRHHSQTEELQISDQQIIEELQAIGDEDEGDEQANELVISSIDSIEDGQINDVPCIEFVLFDDQNEKIFSKVWNTLLDNWDVTLQQQLEEKEMTKWKEQINTKK
ncbi:hypothetical protein [Lysinibacillus sp. BW-2-10]|uniref:hypothetical protein n=1 Tax=Lysinibacillus sp. BW-2-10 TaxID=2590030 RepID=UPI00117F58DE|nr:hypothetical protein [Lysinibacillus sp. BW-2-10]TSI05271.1 hypothetical protein FJQ64_13270 [Lysinibacillus sp. BW-2-10]